MFSVQLRGLQARRRSAVAHLLDDPDGDILEFEEDAHDDASFFGPFGDPDEDMKLFGGGAASEVVF